MGRPLARTTRSPWPFWAGMLLLCGLGCQRHPLGDGLPAKMDCSSCHGGPDNAAPPRAVNGATSTADIRIGAHQSHMKAGQVSHPVACEECHVVPTLTNTPDHPDPLSRPAAVSFGTLAKTSQASPAWDRTKATCANSYCHGATLWGGDTRPAPHWTKVDGSQLKCDACHSNPPGDSSHAVHTDYTCDTCHGSVVAANATILNPDLHVNGHIDVAMSIGTWDPAAKTCAATSCHGSGSIAW